MNRQSPVGLMLHFAFGPSPAGTRSSSGPAIPADGAAVRETAPELLALAAAASAWWNEGRPEGWSLQQHLVDPAAGCNGTAQERLLAESVARWERQEC